MSAIFKYDRCGDFNEGLAWVCLNDKYGFVNKDGVEVIPPIYDSVNDFCEGMAGVSVDDKYGFINTQGHVVVPICYDKILDFSEGFAVVAVENEGHWLIEKYGNIATKQKYEDCYGFCNGIGAVKIGGLWGFIDTSGKIVIKPQFDDICDFSSSDFIEVCIADKYGLINRQGNIILPVKFDSINRLSDSFYAIKQNDYWSWVHIQKDIITNQTKPIYFDDLAYFEHNIIDYDNNRGIYTKYEDDRESVEELEVYSQNGKYGFMNLYGDIIIPMKYDFALPFSGGYAVVKKDFKWGFIDRHGNEVVPLQYDYVSSFHNGYAKVQLNEKWNYIKRRSLKLLITDKTNQ
jgi:hypothetical protein